jgi:hypothetical protein
VKPELVVYHAGVLRRAAQGAPVVTQFENLKVADWQDRLPLKVQALSVRRFLSCIICASFGSRFCCF